MRRTLAVVLLVMALFSIGCATKRAATPEAQYIPSGAWPDGAHP